MNLFQNSANTHFQLAALGLAMVTWTMHATAATDRILFHFLNSTNSPAWQIVNDDVMGGVSRSQFQLLSAGAVFEGLLSLENNGGFASVRSAPLAHNLSGLSAFVLRVRGDGRRYKFTVRTETGFDSPLYQCAFLTEHNQWQELRLSFREFVPTFRGRILTDVPPLNPAKVCSVGFLIGDKQEGPFRLEIAWVKAGGPQNQ